MEDKLTTAQEAAIGFSRKLRASDLAQVVDFDSRVSIAQPFTSNVADLEGAIRRTSPGGSTSLHNAIYIALKELKKVQARSSEDIRRQAIIVLSDGEDTSSLVSFDEVLELAKRSETAIYSIGLRSRGPERARGSFNESDFVLRQLAQETGGKAYFARAASRALADLRADLATSCPASTWSATARRTPSATAPGAASSSASPARARPHAPSKGITDPHRSYGLRATAYEYGLRRFDGVTPFGLCRCSLA